MSAEQKETVSQEVKDARAKVLSTNKVVQVNLEAADAAEKGEVYYGGTK